MSGAYPTPNGGYTPNGYPPGDNTGDNSRVIAAVIATLVVGAAAVGGWYGVNKALSNHQTRQQASRLQAEYARGARFYQAGHYQEAIEALSAVRNDPASSVELVQQAAIAEAYCYRMLGQQAQNARNYLAAEQWFLRAVQVAPEDAGARAELEAVRKALAVLNAPPLAAGQSSPSGNAPSADATPLPPLDEATQKARDAQERLERGNTLLSQGHMRDACREWHEALLTSPGSPAGQAAMQQRQRHCQGL